MNRAARRLLRAAAFLVLCGSAPSHAASVAEMDLEQLVRRSPRIVHGTVVRSWASWDASHRFIWTHHELRLMEALRGLPEAKLVVSVPGGELDGMTMHVPGVTRFAVGEEAVVFAYQAPNGFLRVRGLGQGKFAVGLDAQGVKTVGSSLESLRLLRPVSSAKQPPPKAAASPPGTLDGLLHRVRTLVAEELR